MNLSACSKFTLFLTLLFATTALALEPKQIVVLYNKASPTSLEVARYYLNARQIPRENLIAIDHCPVQEFIASDIYEKIVRPQVVAGLAKIGMTDQVKCLVTTYDIPLRVEGVLVSKDKQPEVDADRKSLTDITNQLTVKIDEYNRIAAQAGIDTEPAPRPLSPDAKDWQKAAANLNAAANRAARRIATLTGNAQQAALAEMLTQQEKVGGLTAILATIHVRSDSPNQDLAQKRLTEVQNRIADLEQQFTDVRSHIDSPAARAKLIALRLETHGLIGQAEMTDEILDYLDPPETGASLDNELTLCLADQNYPRARWILNPLNVEFYPAVQRLKNIPRTLMVCRVDGTTPAKAEEMMRTTLITEKKGLEGKIYLDARGLHGTDGYAAYDANIRSAADWLKNNAAIPVMLDDNPQLLMARDCPDCALYCGWYSVHHYVDSCQWLPGAVGFHVASFELTSLHTFHEPGWVPNLLDRGFCGTLGPVSEPYLHSFPKPQFFFPLLLSGHFTQGEVWQLTCPLLSWQQTFVGDPLYNPFKAHPKVKLQSLQSDTILRNAFEILH